MVQGFGRTIAGRYPKKEYKREDGRISLYQYLILSADDNPFFLDNPADKI
jgi:hypothetical protein